MKTCNFRLKSSFELYLDIYKQKQNEIINSMKIHTGKSALQFSLILIQYLSAESVLLLKFRRICHRLSFEEKLIHMYLSKSESNVCKIRRRSSVPASIVVCIPMFSQLRPYAFFVTRDRRRALKYLGARAGTSANAFTKHKTPR